MVARTNSLSEPDDSAAAFDAELQFVRAELSATVEALQAPLHHLVRAQVSAVQPEVRAAIVLAAGVTAAGADVEPLRSRRIYLAAALEMLAVALSIHKLLLMDEGTVLDKSILGGTILAGDYCFSRSAALAVQTDNPEVVRLFSTALQRVSEGNLRALFALENDTPGLDGERPDHPYDDNQELFRAGVIASLTLVGAPVESGEPLLIWADRLARVLALRPTSPPDEIAALYAEASELPPPQRDRCRHLVTWLYGR